MFVALIHKSLYISLGQKNKVISFISDKTKVQRI